MEKFKLPSERKEYKTFDTLSTEDKFIMYCTSLENIQAGGEMSDVDNMLENWYSGNQDEVDAYFESLED